jgi:hypothetical protein
MDQMISATIMETAIHVSENMMVSDVDGAWVVPSATEELEKPFSNAVDSKQERHSTSLAQLISELLIVRDMHVTSAPRSVLKVTMVNSQML